MDQVKEFLDTLPAEDVRKIREWITNHPEELPQKEEHLIDALIYNVSWDYKSRAESAPPEEARKLQATKEKLYDKWRKLGFIK
jgi:hypothetical protein